MASWKKVIVSGSSAALQQLSVDTHITASGIISSSGQIVANDITLSGDISVTQITASIISASTSLTSGTIVNDSPVADSRLTGSFTGSFVGTFANSDGSSLGSQTLQEVMDQGAAGTRSTTSTSITSSADTILSGSGNIVAGGTSTLGIITNDSPVADTKLTGSLTGSFKGDATITTLTDNQVVIAGTNGELEGDTNLTFDSNTLSGTSLKISALDITGSIISASANLIAGTTTLGGTTVSTLINNSAVDSSHLTGSFTGSFKGTFTNSDGTALEAEWDGTRDGNSEITGSGAGPSLVLSGSTDIDLRVLNNAVISGSLHATTFEPTGSGDLTIFSTVGNNDLTIGASDTTVKIVGDIIELGDGEGDLVDIKGDLKVAGTSSFTHATNLTVADKYILLNSGSEGSNSDSGGIVIQGPNSDSGVGNLFGYVSGSTTDSDGKNRRWAIASNFDATASADFVAEAFMSTVMLSSVEGNVDPGSANDLFKKPGNIFIDQTSGIPYIYV